MWPEARLIVETDSRTWHDTADAFERDRVRDARLTAAGWRVVRFTRRRVRTEPGAVADLVRTLRVPISLPSAVDVRGRGAAVGAVDVRGRGAAVGAVDVQRA